MQKQTKQPVWVDTAGIVDDGATERTCPACGETFDRDSGNSFDAIAESGKCSECNSLSKNWSNNSIQFPRFLEEAQAAGAFTAEVIMLMADSMSLEREDVYEVLERARVVWEELKAQTPPCETGPSADELISEYGCWGEHPDCPRKDWQYEVANNDTNLGYWDWTANRIEEGL